MFNCTFKHIFQSNNNVIILIIIIDTSIVKQY